MGSVNLYKIDNEKQQMFFQELARKMDNIDTIFLERQDEHQELVTYGCTLYMSGRTTIKSYHGIGYYKSLINNQ